MNRLGATSAVMGVALLLIGTYLHPMHADPNAPVAAFAEYAADSIWVASHLLQLAGVALMMVALLLFAWGLEASNHEGLARVGAAGAIASGTLAAALQAVDGVALKAMVNAWAAAPALNKPALFQAAFAVRQIEVGLASMFCLAMGFTATVFGIMLLGNKTYPKWFATLAIAGGVPTGVAGIVMAFTGFSELAMVINMPANLLLLSWMLVLGVFMWRPA